MTQKSVSDLRVKILSALSDPTRLGLLDYLAGGERCVWSDGWRASAPFTGYGTPKSSS